MSIEKIVQSKYGAVATSGLSTNNDGVRAVAEAFGYSKDELDSIPAESNMGLSCGNPIAFATLKPGETVVDLGSGGGLDVFLAAKQVGPRGKAIGIDMTPEMVELAKKNAEKLGDSAQNVEFHLATIDNLPLPNSSVDCIISNCVVNLATDKSKVFKEMARVLKPGGRVAISDIALKKPLPAALADNLMAYVGCISGAIEIKEYRKGLTAAGFSSVDVIDSGTDLNAYSKVEGQSGCCSPPMNDANGLPVLNQSCCGTESTQPNDVHSGLIDLLTRYDVNEFAASVKVFAVR
jgi:arsenite methyltransferase